MNPDASTPSLNDVPVFVRRAIDSIRETQRTGTGVPAVEVVARLEAKLAAARHTKRRRS